MDILISDKIIILKRQFGGPIANSWNFNFEARSHNFENRLLASSCLYVVLPSVSPH